MKLQLLRNATLKLDILGRTVLIDPYFAPRHAGPSFAGRSRNPLVELPVGTDEILAGVELVIVSHLHSDHFDTLAQSLLPKHLPVVCQPGDEATIRAAGFQDVTPLLDRFEWQGIRLSRREGSHGLGPVVETMGSVMGFTIEAEGEPTVYWAGDTVLYPPVEETIRTTSPDVVIVHACGARWDGDLITMDAEQAVAVCEASPRSIVIATHMEALDHATVSRDDLRALSQARGIAADRLRIPADGDVLELGVGRPA